MLRGAAYPRYSSDNQRAESIDAQLYEINEYAQKNGITIVKTYTDEAKTATTDDRPGFQHMMDDAKLGLFDVILVHKLDRFARNRYDSAIYKKKLKGYGIKLISISEKLDDSPESIVLESVLEGMAEYYSANLAREAMKGLKDNARKCLHNGGRPPLGLDVDPNTRQYIPSVNVKEIEAIELIFTLYDQGKGYDTIIKELRLRGYKTKIGRDFAKNGLYEILRNEKYIGTYTYNRSAPKTEGKRNNHKSKPADEIFRVEDAFPAIVDKELFWRVQAKMDTRKQAKARNKAKATYLVSGLIFCGECGAAMVGNSKTYRTQKDGLVRHHYYECNRRDRTKDCTNPQVKREFVDDFVLNELKEKIFNVDMLHEVVRKINEHNIKKTTNNNADLELLNKELEQINTQLNNLVNALAQGGMQFSSIADKMKELENNKTIITNRIEELNKKAKTALITPGMIEAYLGQHRRQIEEKDYDACKQFISKYIEYVAVNHDEIEVEMFLDIDGGGGAYRAITRRTKEEIRYTQRQAQRQIQHRVI